MTNASIPEVKVKSLMERITNVTMMRVQVKTLLCFLLLTFAHLAYYFLCDGQIVDIENEISKIKIENAASPNEISKIKIKNAAPPNGITLYESFLEESKIISTIHDIHKQKVDVKWTGEMKPKLYLHVGPPKHGTTSLQCALARIQVSCTLALPPNRTIVMRSTLNNDISLFTSRKNSTATTTTTLE
jgi:hypothetical protein